MSKRIHLVCMVSLMASTCNHYVARCTKTEPEILWVKRGQKQRNAPEIVRKRRNRVRFGCWRGVQSVRTGGEPQNLNPNAPHNHTTHEKKETGENPGFSPVLWQGQKDLVSAAASGAAPRWGAPSTARGGSRDRRRSLRATGTHSPHDTHCAGRSRASLPSPYAR